MPSVAASTPLLADFPDWLGAMSVKELRQGLRKNSFILIFLALHLAMFVWTLAMAILPEEAEAIDSFFWMILGGSFFVNALRGFVAIRTERQANTLELLQLTGLSPWAIVFGKWFVLMLQILLIGISLSPYAIVRYFLGTLNVPRDLTVFMILLSVTALLAAGAVAVSMLKKYGLIIFGVLTFMFGPVLGITFLQILALAIFGMYSIGVAMDDVWIYLILGISAYATLYSMLLLGLSALPLSSAIDNNATRLKMLGWSFLVPSTFACAAGAELTVSLLCFGASMPGLVVIGFYSLGSKTVHDALANQRFLRYGIVGELLARFLAPTSKASANNVILLTFMTLVVGLFPFWIESTKASLTALLGFIFYFGCISSALSLPFLVSAVTKKSWDKDTVLFASGAFLLFGSVVAAVVAIDYENRLAQTLTCLSPLGALFISAKQQDVNATAWISLVVQLCIISIYFFLKTRAKKTNGPHFAPMQCT